MFGGTDGQLWPIRGDVGALDRSPVDRTEAPTDAPAETLDVRERGPPEPLRRTLELLPTLDDDTVLGQSNDRAPRRLYPKLEDRGYSYETVPKADERATVIRVDGDGDSHE